MASLEARELTKSFAAGRRVLDGVSLRVADGEFFTLLGPSGCGKTTLLRIVAGLESPDGGRVLLGGEDVTPLSPARRDVAMVFQGYALYPHMTVKENVSIGLALRGTPEGERDARVREAASLLGIEDLLDRRPSALSGGQQQRVAVARAIVRRPKVFLMDEPLSNLDASLRERTRAELRLLFRRIGGTVLYVTHDQVEAMTLSDRLGVMNEGRLSQVGTPQEVHARPATSFVAGFVGMHRMNLLPIDGEFPVRAPRGAATCGIRPEDVSLADGGSAPIECEVLLVEPLGSGAILHLRTGKETLRAVIRGEAPSVGARVRVSLPPERIHWFDAEGRRVAE